MSFIVEIADPEGLYDAAGSALAPGDHVRQAVGRLGERLATGTDELLQRRAGSQGRFLCVVILRGGAMLYPGFAAVFDRADFCMVGIGRDVETRLPRYRYHTQIPGTAYDVVVYVDCVAATGNTILEVRRLITAQCRVTDEVAAVLASSKSATDTIERAGVGLVGFSLYEGLDSDVVMPDLGKRDAGDLFSGAELDRERG